jgi:hypothetical protein
MQEFYIIKDSVNPVLEMELIDDGRYDFKRSLFNEALQDSEVTFSMKDEDTGIMKISKSKANVVLAIDDVSEEKYILQYKWSKRDVSKKGTYEAWFEITFNENIISDGIEYPKGNLKVPVEEKLRIIIH